MLKKQTFVLSVLFIAIGFSMAQAQTRLHITNGCNFYGEETETEYYKYDPSDEAQQIVDELLKGSGISSRAFQLKASNCSNAVATTLNGVRYILYNPDFLRKFKQDADTKWAAYGVLAHEIGHHVNGHKLDEPDPSKRKEYELEADKYAGNLLFILHATIEQAQSCIKNLPFGGDNTSHPPNSARLVAFTTGWTAAYDLSRGVEPKVVEQVPETPSLRDLFAAINVPAVDNEQLAREWFDKGLNVIDSHKKIEYYTKAIELKPDYSEAFCSRGNAKSNLGQYREAIIDHDQAIILKPDAIKYNSRGAAKDRLGQYREAIADYDQAIRLKPEYGLAFGNRGLAKKALSRYQEAIEDFDQAIRLKPNDADAFNNRGLAKKALSRYQEAIEDFDQAIQLDPKLAYSYANKGCCLVKMNEKSRMGEAIDLINKGLALDSTLGYAKDCKKDAIKKLQE
jgi:tetratricopeptide (TPR) repeat protein